VEAWRRGEAFHHEDTKITKKSLSRAFGAQPFFFVACVSSWFLSFLLHASTSPVIFAYAGSGDIPH